MSKSIRRKKRTDPNYHPFRAVCGYCGAEFEVPAYRVYISRYRKDAIWCSPACRRAVAQMRGGYPPGVDCLAAVTPRCENQRSTGRLGLCLTHYSASRTRKRPVEYVKSRKTSVYWKTKARACKTVIRGRVHPDQRYSKNREGVGV